MPGTGNGSGQWIDLGGEKHELIYSMLSLEKIETQFGSVAAMQAAITDEKGQVQLDRPVVKLLIDILHAGLLHDYEDTTAARRVIATALRPGDLDTVVEAFTTAFTDSFGQLGERILAEGGESVTPQLRPVPNRATRRAQSHSPNGTTSPPSSSKEAKKSGKK
jgi:hypothetical protein